MADRAFLERLSRELANEGKLIEAGWVGFRLAVIPPDAPAIQLEECKMAFFAGSLHLFSSMMTIMDPEAEPTDADLKKMSLIHEELERFGQQFELIATKAKGSA